MQGTKSRRMGGRWHRCSMAIERLESRELLAADLGLAELADPAAAFQQAAVAEGEMPVASIELQGGGFQLLPGDRSIAAAEGHQMEADISRGGNQTLVVWSDYRSTPDDAPPFATEGTGADIYGQILDAQGQAVAATPFVINQDFGNQDLPTVSWNGNSWLVVWKTETTTLPTYEKIVGIRVASDGTLLDATPIEIHNNQSYYENFEPYQVASDGQGWLVVFQPNGPQQGVFATRVAGDGTLPDANPTQIHATQFSTTVDVAFAADEYLITWDDTVQYSSGPAVHA